MKQPLKPLHLRIILATIFLVTIFTGVILAQNPDTRPPAGVLVKVERGHGSGVHIGNGYIVTAAHVVGEAKTVEIKTEDGQTITADIVWSNKDYDVALAVARGLKAHSRSLSCKDPIVGTEIQAFGNPLSLEFVRTWGHVAAVVMPRAAWKSTYIADITVAGGVSGGPVYDRHQRVVGIVVGTAVQSMGFAGSIVALTYVVPASAVCALLARS